ncbi:hypothetical protein SAMN04489712_11559 [Thermomonospora echinospora]|uniref:Uncharacterized protein n=1 Tax=Thermomonospora echinospora TaxID=1992 RepID=A0A1H6DCZ8_9ACTN|nr:hypothetical protein [Thermomonospora echinospora]SEG82663.1 hypothetical protein SAMN04489712_11559 [Thermomonospora echinospora]
MLKRLATAGVLAATVGGMLVSAAPAVADNGPHAPGKARKHSKTSQNGCGTYGEKATMMRSLEILEIHYIVIGNSPQVGFTIADCKQD